MNPRQTPTHARSGLAAPRDATVDNAKAMGIVLVVLGHTMGLPGWAAVLIYAVHMPLFFLISGSLIKESAWSQPVEIYLGRQLRMMLLPFAVFFAMSYAYWLLTFRIGSSAAKFAGVAWYEPVAGLFTARFAELDTINGPLWFFGALLVASIAFVVACRWFGSRLGPVVVIGVALIALAFGSPSGVGLWWSVDVAIVAAGFVALGHVLARRTRLAALSRRGAVFGAMAVAPLFVLVASSGGKVDMAQRQYGDHPLHFLAAALIGIALVMLIARALPPSALARWLSAHSLVIFPTHVLMLNLISGAAQLGLGWGQDDVRTTAFALASTALALLAAWPMARLLQWLLPSVFRPMGLPPAAPATGSAWLPAR